MEGWSRFVLKSQTHSGSSRPLKSPTGFCVVPRHEPSMICNGSIAARTCLRSTLPAVGVPAPEDVAPAGETFEFPELGVPLREILGIDTGISCAGFATGVATAGDCSGVTSLVAGESCCVVDSVVGVAGSGDEPPQPRQHTQAISGRYRFNMSLRTCNAWFSTRERLPRHEGLKRFYRIGGHVPNYVGEPGFSDYLPRPIPR